jgi:hypothetical protein
MTSVTLNNVDETGLFFSLQPSKTLTFRGDFCRGGIKSEKWVTVLHACNVDGSDKLPPLVTKKYKIPHCFNSVKRLPTKYEANTYSWMTTKIFEDYLTQLDRKLGARNRKISLFIDQCTAHLKNTTFLSNNVFLPAHCTGQLQPLDLGISHAFRCHYRKQLILKTVAMIDRGLLQDAA